MGGRAAGQVYDMENLLPLYDRFLSPDATQYAVCLYKGFNALSGLEYIFHFPNNIGEILFCVLVMTVSVWLDGNILGTLLYYMVDKDPVALAHRRLMEELHEFVENKHLPPDLAARVVKHFEFQHDKAVENRASASVQLPRSLAIKVSNCKYRGVIDKCTARGEVFFGCSPQFLNALVMKLNLVFYMPSEEVFKKDDLSRQLCLVLKGACYVMDDDRIKRVVRDDVPNSAPILGELAFFIGILQPMAVRARPDGDVQLLVITREDSSELFNNYPEQLEIIRKNILNGFGLDDRGNSISEIEEEEDADRLTLKNAIKVSLSRQHDEMFAALAYAAKAGDVEIVRELLRRGAEIDDVDYDKRSVLAMASFEGSYKVVELLLEEGANKNTKNRWGQTPLQEAMENRQGPVVELLTQWKASIDPDQAAGALCAAAACGDIDKLRRLVDNKIDPNQGDYDMRTAIHVASAEGHSKVVAFLISSKAEVNPKDRWGGTPLQAAVSFGHVEVANMLKSKGGVMPESVGATQLCDAAAKGDVQTLRLLVECAGIQTNKGDYDSRCAMHLAAAEARILAVSYLLGISAEPNILDRWGNTPLDESLKGGTLYHLYCARLIHGWGGRLGTLKGTTEGKQLLAKMRKISIDDVRKLIQHLIARGYDKKIPERRNEQEILVSREVSSELVVLTYNIKLRLEEVCLTFEKNLGLRSAYDVDQLFHILESEENADSDPFEDACGCIDSDEEAKLYEELDTLLESQERALAFRGNSNKFMANAFQKVFLRIQELEYCFELSSNDISPIPFLRSPEDLQYSLSLLSISGLSHFELEDMLEEAGNCPSFLSHLPIQNHIPESSGILSFESSQHAPISIVSLMAGSESFRNHLNKVKTNAIFCELMQSSLAMFLTPSRIRKLAEDGKEMDTSRLGSQVYASRDCKKGAWYLLLSGKLKVSLDMPSSQDADKIAHYELNSGEVFGGYDIHPESADVVHVRIETMQPAKYIELSGESLGHLMHQDPETGSQMLGMMGGSTWQYLSEERQYKKNEETAYIFSSADKSRYLSERERRNSLAPSDEKDINGRGERKPCSEIEIYAIKTAIGVIESLWRDISMGSDSVSVTVLKAIHQHLGEIGSELFRRIFLSRGQLSKLSKREFWSCWTIFLAEELFLQNHHELLDPDLLYDDISESGVFIGDNAETELGFAAEDIESEDGWDEDPNCFEMLHSRFARSRKLKQLFFNEDLAERYESAFSIVAGDIKKPITLKQVPEFLENLFPSFPYRFSAYNVRETMSAFGREGPKTKLLFWSDIRKSLREHKKGKDSISNHFFIKSALNPHSSLMRRWQQLIFVLALYHFVAVPIRIGFAPWSNMLDSRALFTDLPADVLTFLNLALCCNTAYRNSKSAWVTKRHKIIRRIDFRLFVAPIPLDWFAFACGASNQLCCWLRLPKLLLTSKVLISDQKASLMESRGSSTRKKLLYILAVVLSVVHIGSCIWFFIGSQYQFWFPGRGISWYTAEDQLMNTSFIDHINKIGMKRGSAVWEQYIISFYWVVATFTCNGLIGDVIPQNVVEMSFCMILMILNMTLFRYVTGEVSTIVMKSDEAVVDLRSRLEAVESLLQDSRIGSDLQDEIRQHFRATQSDRGVDQAIMFREYLDNVHLFQDCSEKMLDSASVLLREIQFAPEEYLYRAGEIANEMFFVVSGSVDELIENAEGGESQHGKVERTVHSGKGTGELSFFFGMRHLASARAHKSSGALCLRLPREQFLPLLKMFPDDEELIAEAALNSFEVVKSQAGSHRSGSVHSAGQRSETKSAHSFATSNSRKSRLSSKHSADSFDSIGGDPEQNSEEDDTEQAMDKIVGWGMKQKIETLKMRRRQDRINVILTAAARGDVIGMKQAFRKDSGFNSHNSFMRTPLHVAASEGQVEVVRFLINANADIHAKDKFKNNSLNDAVRHRHDEVAALLRASGATLNDAHRNQAGTLICQASYTGNIGEVKRLIENGVSANAADYDGRTGLHLASCEGHQDIVEYLITGKADVTLRDRFMGSALDDAVRHGHSSVQKILRRHGATLDTASCAIQMCDAASRGDVEKIKVLVENGIDCSTGDYDQRTAAHLAASNGKISVLDFLLSQEPKIEINSVDRMGGTALEDARRHGQEIAAVLLQKNGGFLATDPRLIELKKEQQANLMKEQKEMRRSTVKKSVLGSPENIAHTYFEETLIPSIVSALSELQNQAHSLQEAIEQATSTLQKSLPITSVTSLSFSKPPDFLLESREVIDNLIAKISAFSTSAILALEALNSDFPKQRAMHFAAHQFSKKAAETRKHIKICAEIMKLGKKALKETKTLLRPRGIGMYSSTSRTLSI